MFGIAFFTYLSKKLFGNKKNSKRIEDIQLPGFMSIFNENMVSTAILMMIFFGAIMAVLGKDYFIETKVLKEGASKAEADDIKAKLEAEGAKITLK